MCWRNFCNFSLVTKKCESRSKITLFSKERHFEIWFSKRKQLRFSEVNYLNYTKKTQFLHVTSTFYLKQGVNKNKQRTHSTPVKKIVNASGKAFGIVRANPDHVRTIAINLRLKLKLKTDVTVTHPNTNTNTGRLSNCYTKYNTW